MPAARLLTAGEAFEDLVFLGLARLPNPGEELKTDAFHATIGGGAVITAIGTARLGLATSIVSALSDAAVTRLRRERVAVTNLRRAGEPHAITAALSTATDRTFVTFNGVNAVLEPRLRRALATTDATHLHLALCPRDVAAWTRLVGRLRRRGVTVSWDFGWNECLATDPALSALIDVLDLVFLNELEAPLYAHAPSLDAACTGLRTARSNVVVKLGVDGSRWLRADGDVSMPAPAANAVDTTGAGDAFNAGFLTAWLRKAGPEECLALGNDVGAASTERPGGIDGLPARRDLPHRGPTRRVGASSSRVPGRRGAQARGRHGSTSRSGSRS